MFQKGIDELFLIYTSPLRSKSSFGHTTELNEGRGMGSESTPQQTNKCDGGTGQCVILVGGRGTRLGKLTDTLPKPLMEVGGKPFLYYLVNEAYRHGFRRILLLAGYKSDALISAAHLMESEFRGISVDVTVEPEPLGTAGALVYAKDGLEPEFLVLNGDSLFDINLLDLVTREVEAPWLVKMALKPKHDMSRYG